MQHRANPFLLNLIAGLLLAGLSCSYAQRVRTWDVYFEYGSARLSPEARRALDAITLKGAASITIEGHTDGVGSEAYNNDLAGRRVDAVAGYLSQMQPGAPVPQRAARGESQPAAPNELNGSDNPGGRQQNRRVTIIATFPGGPTMLIPEPPSA
jgi:OOP family OmpA-OmpF porin